MTAPISKALEEAIERAGRLIAVNRYGIDAIPSVELSHRCRADAEAFLRQALPGLFDGTMWLAPWEAIVTRDMESAGAVAIEWWRESADDYTMAGKVFEAMFAAMREAYLNAGQPLDPDAGLPTPEDVRGILKEQKD